MNFIAEAVLEMVSELVSESIDAAITAWGAKKRKKENRAAEDINRRKNRCQ